MNTTYILLSILTITNFIIVVYLLYNHFIQKEINIDNELDIEDILSEFRSFKNKVINDIDDSIKETTLLHKLLRDTEIDIKSDTRKRLESLTEQIIKKIPITNDELLKEVQQMRDDFFALRQNF